MVLSYIMCFLIWFCVCFSHRQVKAKFTVDDHSHYLFTPCILTQWVLSLLRYDLTAGNALEELSTLHHLKPDQFVSCDAKQSRGGNRMEIIG